MSNVVGDSIILQSLDSQNRDTEWKVVLLRNWVSKEVLCIQRSAQFITKEFQKTHDQQRTCLWNSYLKRLLDDFVNNYQLFFGWNELTVKVKQCSREIEYLSTSLNWLMLQMDDWEQLDYYYWDLFAHYYLIKKYIEMWLELCKWFLRMPFRPDEYHDYIYNSELAINTVIPTYEELVKSTWHNFIYRREGEAMENYIDERVQEMRTNDFVYSIDRLREEISNLNSEIGIIIWEILDCEKGKAKIIWFEILRTLRKTREEMIDRILIWSGLIERGDWNEAYENHWVKNSISMLSESIRDWFESEKILQEQIVNWLLIAEWE